MLGDFPPGTICMICSDIGGGDSLGSSAFLSTRGFFPSRYYKYVFILIICLFFDWGGEGGDVYVLESMLCTDTDYNLLA